MYSGALQKDKFDLFVGREATVLTGVPTFPTVRSRGCSPGGALHNLQQALEVIQPSTAAQSLQPFRRSRAVRGGKELSKPHPEVAYCGPRKARRSSAHVASQPQNRGGNVAHLSPSLQRVSGAVFRRVMFSSLDGVLGVWWL